jgi:hypothetical protein
MSCGSTANARESRLLAFPTPFQLDFVRSLSSKRPETCSGHDPWSGATRAADGRLPRKGRVRRRVTDLRPLYTRPVRGSFPRVDLGRGSSRFPAEIQRYDKVAPT